MTNNIDICHKFFYQNNDRFYPSYKSLGYNGDRFFSYSTIIGKKITGKNGNDYLLLSDDTFSNTTAKHINDLRQASPLEIVYIPVDYGQNDITIDKAIEDIKHNLDFYNKSKLTLKNNRQSYINYFNMLSVIDEKIQDIDQALFDQYKPLFEILTNSEKTRELKQKLQEQEKIKRENLKKQLKTYLDQFNICQLAKMVFDRNDQTLHDQPDIKKAIKDYIDPKNDLAFIWEDSENYKTSKLITIAKKDCQLLIDLYKSGKLKHGFKLGYYTVLEVTSEFLRIGCHKIPVANINCLI